MTPLQESTNSEAKDLSRAPRGAFLASHAWAGILALAVVYTLYFARSLLLPIFLALFLSALLQPLVKELNRLKIPDGVGAALVLLLFVLLFGLGIYQLSSPASDWMKRGPVLLQKAESKFWKVKQSIQEVEKRTEQIEDIAKLDKKKEEEKVTIKGPSLAEKAMTQTWLFLATAFVILVLIYFILAAGRGTMQRFSNSLQNGEDRERVDRLLLRIQQDIASYLGTIAVIYLGVGSLTAVAMGILGMPTPVLWGAVAFVLHFIPFLGPVMTLFIICMVSVVSFDTGLRMLLPPLVYMFVALLEGYLITPMILGKRLTLNPIIVLVSFLFWGWIWGIPGIFLAVPILTGLKIICDDIGWLNPLGQVLGSDKTREQDASVLKMSVERDEI